MTHLLIATLAPWGPWLALAVLLVLLVETAIPLGFVLPGDTLLITLGVLAAQGALALPLWLVGVAGVVGAVAGNRLGYELGRRWGLRRAGRPRGGVNRWSAHLDHASGLFAKRGVSAVVMARFMPLARTFVPLVAGAAGMNRRRFGGANLAGGLLWVAGLLTAGFFLGGNPVVAHHLDLLLVALAGVWLLGTIVHSRSTRGSRKRHTRTSDRPAAGLSSV